MDKRDKRNDISRDGARRPPFRARRERPQGKETPLSAREVARRAPRGRVLFETDGLSAVEWAQGRSVRAQDVGAVLEAALREAAAIRGEAPETLRREAAQAYAARYAQTFAEE